MASAVNPQRPASMNVAAYATGRATGRVGIREQVAGSQEARQKLVAQDARGGWRDPTGREIPRIIIRE